MNIDERVVYILNILNEYGQAYLVGGALRDILERFSFPALFSKRKYSSLMGKD